MTASDKTPEGTEGQRHKALCLCDSLPLCLCAFVLLIADILATTVAADGPDGKNTTQRVADSAKDSPDNPRPEQKQPPILSQAFVEVHVQPAAWKRGFHPLSSRELPLQSGDKIQLHVKLTEPVYVYLFWYDSQGRPERLWPKHIDDQKPVTELWEPSLAADGQLQKWYVLGGQVGMEMALAVTSKSPLGAKQLTSFEKVRLRFVRRDKDGRLVPISLAADRGIVGRKRSPKGERQNAEETVSVLVLPNGSESKLVAVKPATADERERGIVGQAKSVKRPAEKHAAPFEELLIRRFDSYYGLVFAHQERP